MIDTSRGEAFYQVKFDEPTDLLDASLKNKITVVNEKMVTASFPNHNIAEVGPSPDVEVMRFSLLGSDKMGSLLKANVNDLPQELQIGCVVDARKSIDMILLSFVDDVENE